MPSTFDVRKLFREANLLLDEALCRYKNDIADACALEREALTREHRSFCEALRRGTADFESRYAAEMADADAFGRERTDQLRLYEGQVGMEQEWRLRQASHAAAGKLERVREGLPVGPRPPAASPAPSLRPTAPWRHVR